MLAFVRSARCLTVAVFGFAALVCAGLARAQSPAGPQAVPDPDKPFMDAYRSVQPITTWPLKTILHEIPELKGLRAAAGQSELAGTVAQVAANLQVFWKEFQNTSSLETIQESRQLTNSPFSDPDRAVQQFRYLMLTNPNNPLEIREYRTDLQGRERESEQAVSGFLRTSGFTSLPLVFGPGEQPLTDYRDLGSQVLRHHSCRVIAFAQHVDAAAASRWTIEGEKIPVLVQGVAWIDPAGGQVLQMRTDLLAPQPRVGLRRATTVVTFAPVQFHNKRGVFWLPLDVTVTVDLDKYTFVNRHTYSDYQVFTVVTS